MKKPNVYGAAEALAKNELYGNGQSCATADKIFKHPLHIESKFAFPIAFVISSAGSSNELQAFR